MRVFSSGISMYAMGLLLGVLLGWDFNFSIIMSAVIVLVYIFLGGLTSAIYNEVLQFFLIVFGFVPLVFLGLRTRAGGRLESRLAGVATSQGYAAGAWTDSWRSRRAQPIPWGSSGSPWSWGSASSSRSATGAPTSSSSSGRWPPTR